MVLQQLSYKIISSIVFICLSKLYISVITVNACHKSFENGMKPIKVIGTSNKLLETVEGFVRSLVMMLQRAKPPNMPKMQWMIDIMGQSPLRIGSGLLLVITGFDPVHVRSLILLDKTFFTQMRLLFYWSTFVLAYPGFFFAFIDRVLFWGFWNIKFGLCYRYFFLWQINQSIKCSIVQSNLLFWI